MAYFFQVTIFVAILASSSSVLSPIIETSLGAVQGKEESGVFQFLGIPFAEPPKGDRRFAKPMEKERWLDTYNATYFRPSCPQGLLSLLTNHLVNQDEDCLHLNIYTSVNVSQGSPKAVMFWVHGGGYYYGSGQDYYGTVLSSQYDVILVTINYRLGALGFLNTKDENAGGNQGLWDQTMALDWVKRNIAAFGGDPERVTIFGESAGSSAVTQLAISPFTAGLFHRVIAESGTASASWTAYDDSVEAAHKLARRMGCPTDSNQELVKCMRQVPAEDIAAHQDKIYPSNAFVPTFGTDFLPYTMVELTTTQSSSGIAKRFAELEFIIGQNSDEGGIFYPNFVVLEPGETAENVSRLTQTVLERSIISLLKRVRVVDDINVLEKLLDPIKFMYRDWENEYDGIGRAKIITRLLADIFFSASVVSYTRSHAMLRQKLLPQSTVLPSSGGTYMYLFEHRGSWMPMDYWRSGADHADELPFVFGFHLFQTRFNATAAEKDLSSRMLTYWTNFAKTGNPNTPDAGPSTIQWPVFVHDTEHYLKFNVNQVSAARYVYNRRVAFWLDYIPKQLQIFKLEPDPAHCYA